MISVTEAKQLIIQHCRALQPVVLPLQDACGRILADDIFSGVDIPNYPQSSHDGYAFSHAGYFQHKTLQLTGEIAAGDSKEVFVKPNEAVRIFTGAPVPQGTDTVVMQEKIIIQNNILSLQDESILQGASVRPRGSEIRSGDLALEKEALLTPAAIGFLAGIGITEVPVYPSVKVSIIITGNELQQPGSQLNYGQVYEANSFALKAALHAVGVHTIIVLEAKDNLQELTSVLKAALEQTDMVLLTGGVSVGDYDFVAKAAEDCGVEKIFHRVKQKPGKPLYFGKTKKNIVFGLPGNPSSVLTCFYQYVMLALQQMKNGSAILSIMKVPTTADISKPIGLTHFLKGYYDGKVVNVLSAQESFRMSSFAKANCLVEVEEEVTLVKKNNLAKVYHIS